MIMVIEPNDPFTAGAAKRWKKIPAWAQKKILENVWCGGCLDSVPIMLSSAKMRKKDLILEGTCKYCGKSICRVVEPEDE